MSLWPNVRMGDEPPIGIDHEGVSALAHFDLRDDIPDELEIDLGDAHAGVAAGAIFMRDVLPIEKVLLLYEPFAVAFPYESLG